ncbi:MAG: DUF1667 domain-containing protein [Clostridiales bacterium]|jgi:CxxC motif-containing protein|nr:DUF1667 domain-containing protein [Clostridiales bacterium]
MNTVLTCIRCPRGCKLSVEGKAVTGNLCGKGRDYAVEETYTPMRTVCTLVRTVYPEVPVLPVRTDAAVPKSMVPLVITVAGRITVDRHVGRGYVLVPNIAGTGANLIVTAGILLDEIK